MSKSPGESAESLEAGEQAGQRLHEGGSSGEEQGQRSGVTEEAAAVSRHSGAWVRGRLGVSLRDILGENEMNLRVWVDVRSDFYITSGQGS